MEKVVVTLPENTLAPTRMVTEVMIRKGFDVVGSERSLELVVTQKPGGKPLEEYFTDGIVEDMRSDGITIKVS